MAHFVLTDVSAVVNSVDLSDHIKSITLTVRAGMEDDSNMGDTWTGRIAGLKDWDCNINFDQDFAAGEVDATIWSIYNTGTPITFVGKPTSAGVGPTNPTFTGSVLVEEYSPIDGEHGSKARSPVKFAAASSLARATA